VVEPIDAGPDPSRRSSYRGVKELLRDLFNIPISVGTIHNRLQSAAGQACAINRSQNLSAIRVGLHDEIFQGSMPVLAGVDAASTYCYLLADAEHRDADTWAVHLLDANAQGFDPDHTIADAGQGLRAGQIAALGDTPCHGDVFHIQKQCESLANVLARVAMGATSRRKVLDVKMDAAKANSCGNTLSAPLTLARQTEEQTCQLARDVKTLVHWLTHDILALAGPVLAERQALFDFIVPNDGIESTWIRHAFVRCVRHWRNSATICWHSPVCSTRGWPASHRTAMRRCIWFGTSVCCNGNLHHQTPTGSAGTYCTRSLPGNSSVSPTPWPRR
jgi:hypothetical protein